MVKLDFAIFEKEVGTLFVLPSNAAVTLRKKLGHAIDERLKRYPKNSIQNKKNLFVERAVAIAGIPLTVSQPYKVINNLKSSGNSHERITKALFFTCCRTKEFDDVRLWLSEAFSRNDVHPSRVAPGWPPKISFYLSDILNINYPIANAFEDTIDFDPSAHLEQIIGPKDPVRSTSTSILETDQDKVAGRSFIETHLSMFVSRHSSSNQACLAIIDIDDLTKINKVYTSEVGDRVIDKVLSIIRDMFHEQKIPVGRCGDDTFYVVLCDLPIGQTGVLMDTLKTKIVRFAWNQLANGLRVSVSIGIANSRALEDSTQLAIRAGIGMQQAKSEGGNRVSLGPEYLPLHFIGRCATSSIWS